jgi:histidyl-tRNA synthetase
MDFEGRSLKSSMKLADRSRARFALIIGDNELLKGLFVLRDMQSGEQTEVTEADLFEKFRN